MATRISKFQRRAQRTLSILLAWIAVGVVVAFFHWAVVRSLAVPISLVTLVHFHFWRSLAWGFFGGGIYIFVLRDRLRSLPFLNAYAIMTALVFFTVISYHLLIPRLSGPVTTPLVTALREPWMWADFLYRAVLMGGTMIMVRLNDQFASGSSGFLFGRYFKPRQELRIFMFLDMRSSTAIAEKIGDTRYFQLLNELYADITDPVIYSEGDIYQYVGDEVSVSWDLRKGIKGQRCLKCFFAIREKLAKRAPHYVKRYGITPEFKAGFHYGQVTTGEVGLLKKQMIFSGDAVNTAAHIQASCNDHGVNLLMSKEMLDVLALSPDKWVARDLGEAHLKGKRQNVQLYTVEPV
jgi:adenylate cyclase